MSTVDLAMWLAILDRGQGARALLLAYQARVEQMRAEAGRA